MKKLKKWLIFAGLLIGAIIMLLISQGESNSAIKNRMKRRKLKMDDLKEREGVLKEKIKNSDDDGMTLSGELLALQKEKRAITKTVKDEIKVEGSQ